MNSRAALTDVQLERFRVSLPVMWHEHLEWVLEARKFWAMLDVDVPYDVWFTALVADGWLYEGTDYAVLDEYVLIENTALKTVKVIEYGFTLSTAMFLCIKARTETARVLLQYVKSLKISEVQSLPRIKFRNGDHELMIAELRARSVENAAFNAEMDALFGGLES